VAGGVAVRVGERGDHRLPGRLGVTDDEHEIRTRIEARQALGIMAGQVRPVARQPLSQPRRLEEGEAGTEGLGILGANGPHEHVPAIRETVPLVPGRESITRSHGRTIADCS
jgi:hypothetical protein